MGSLSAVSALIYFIGVGAYWKGDFPTPLPPSPFSCIPGICSLVAHFVTLMNIHRPSAVDSIPKAPHLMRQSSQCLRKLQNDCLETSGGGVAK